MKTSIRLIGAIFMVAIIGIGNGCAPFRSKAHTPPPQSVAAQAPAPVRTTVTNFVTVQTPAGDPTLTTVSATNPANPAASKTTTKKAIKYQVATNGLPEGMVGGSRTLFVNDTGADVKLTVRANPEAPFNTSFELEIGKNKREERLMVGGPYNFDWEMSTDNGGWVKKTPGKFPVGTEEIHRRKGDDGKDKMFSAVVKLCLSDEQ